MGPAILILALATAAPGATLAQQGVIVTGDPLVAPPTRSGSELARHTSEDAWRGKDEPVMVRRSCSGRPAGEVHASASTNGDRAAGATVCVPVGKRGDISLGVDAIQVDPRSAPREPGWP